MQAIRQRDRNRIERYLIEQLGIIRIERHLKFCSNVFSLLTEASNRHQIIIGILLRIARDLRTLIQSEYGKSNSHVITPPFFLVYPKDLWCLPSNTMHEIMNNAFLVEEFFLDQLRGHFLTYPNIFSDSSLPQEHAKTIDGLEPLGFSIFEQLRLAWHVDDIRNNEALN